MDTTTNQVISRSLVCVWVTGIAFPPNWTTLPHGQHMYTWSPASWKSGQPSTTRLCHTLDNHPDNHPLAGQKHIKLPALTSVGILGNDYYWIDGERCIQTKLPVCDPGMHHGTCVTHGGGENVPGIPGSCATRNLTYLTRGSSLWKRNRILITHDSEVMLFSPGVFVCVFVFCLCVCLWFTMFVQTI